MSAVGVRCGFIGGRFMTTNPDISRGLPKVPARPITTPAIGNLHPAIQFITATTGSWGIHHEMVVARRSGAAGVRWVLHVQQQRSPAAEPHDGRRPAIGARGARAVRLGCRSIARRRTATRQDAATHWTGRGVADAVGVSLSAVQRIWQVNRLQPYRIRTFKKSTDHHFGDLVVANFAWSSWPRFIGQIVQPLHRKSLPPRRYRDARDAEPLGDRQIAHALGRKQHDLRAHRVRTRDLAAPQPGRQIGTLVFSWLDANRRPSSHSAFPAPASEMEWLEISRTGQ